MRIRAFYEHFQALRQSSKPVARKPIKKREIAKLTKIVFFWLVAKDVALAGVKKLTLHDTVSASYADLSTQYYLKEEDIGKNRAEVTFPKLSELNPYVAYSLDTREFGPTTTDFSFLKDFTCVVLSGKPLSLQLAVSSFCHEHGIAFITADTYGAFGWAFSDP